MIERWDPDKHMATIRTWFEGHGMRLMGPELLPPTGFIVDGIVACWLYKTDSPVALIDGCIGDPASDKEARAKAIDTLIDTLEAEARRLGFVAIIAVPTVPTLTSRLEGKGYIVKTGAYAVRKVV